MVRTQIQLTEAQHRALQALARKRGVSMAELVREGVDRIVADMARDRQWAAARALVGRFKSPDRATTSAAEDHDRHLADAFGS